LNQPLKNRLVGAAVLLIAAGLLWPLLFDFDEAMLPEPLVLDIPDADSAVEKAKRSPEFAELKSIDRAEVSSTEPASKATVNASTEPAENINAKKDEAVLKDVVSKESASKENSENTVARKSSTITRTSSEDSELTPHLDERGVPVAYVVQVATFGRWDNADRLRNDLIKSQYKAYTRPETSSQTGPYRVLVGPLLTYADAKQASEEIKEQYRIPDTFIRKFGRR